MRKNNFVGTFVGSSSQTLLSKAGTTLITESVEIKITKESKNIYLIRVSYPGKKITYEVLGSLIYDKIYSSNSNPLPNDVNLLNTYYNIFYFNTKGQLRNHSSGMLDGKQYARISKLKRTSSS
jgi:hypothetical protein